MSNDCLRDSGILQIYKIANAEQETKRDELMQRCAFSWRIRSF